MTLFPPVIFPTLLKHFQNAAEKHNKKVGYHLKIDTGMTRLGITSREIDSFLNSVAGYKNINLDGVFTHLSCANDINNDYTDIQLGRFREILSKLEQMKLKFNYSHVANSAAIQKFPESHYNLVRPGIMLYGSGNLNELDLKPVMKLKTKIVQIKKF